MDESFSNFFYSWDEGNGDDLLFHENFGAEVDVDGGYLIFQHWDLLSAKCPVVKRQVEEASGHVRGQHREKHWDEQVNRLSCF